MFYNSKRRNIILVLFCVFLLSLCTFIGISLSDDNLTANATSDSSGLEYTLSDDSTYYIVSGYSGSSTSVLVPNSYQGKSVKEIKMRAFNNNTTIINVTISDSVTTIGYGAFMDCTSLTTVTIG